MALVCGVYCEFVTFQLVSWVRCGTWLYRFLIFAPLLTFIYLSLMILDHPFKFMYSSMCTYFVEYGKQYKHKTNKEAWSNLLCKLHCPKSFTSNWNKKKMWLWPRMPQSQTANQFPWHRYEEKEFWLDWYFKQSKLYITRSIILNGKAVWSGTK